MTKDQQKTLGDKINEANKPMSEKELAAARREDRVRALEEEKAGLKTRGLSDEDVTRRGKEIDAEIKRFKSDSPTGRRPGGDQNQA